MPSTARLVLRIADVAASVFYRKSRLGGEVPADGPVLLVGNHPNGLVDAVFLGTATRRPVRFLGKAPLFDLPVLGSVLRAMGTLPVYRAKDGFDTRDNQRTFDAVFDALDGGDVVALFPEGFTHGEPRIAALRTGAARMALGAEQRASERGAPPLGVRVVPVGLSFQAKRRFRSRAAAWIGEPIEVRDLLELHAREPRDAVRALTDRIAAGLSAVTIGIERWEDLPLVELAERIWQPPEGRRVARIRELGAAAGALRERAPGELARLAGDLAAFGRRLERLGVTVDDVGVRYGLGGVARFTAARLLPTLVAAPVGLVGLALWWPPYRACPPLARLGRPDAETFATTVLLAALVVFPVWWLALSLAAGVAFGPWAALGAFVGAPLLGLIGLSWWERRAQVLADFSVFDRLATRRRLREVLSVQRDALATRIEALWAVAADARRDDVGGPPQAPTEAAQEG